MAQGSVNAWINDYEEAIAIGRAIGDKVIVIGTSTGGSLATWAATQPGASDGVAAIAFISPNFGVQGVRRRAADHAVGQADRRAGHRQGAQLRAAQRAAREILDRPHIRSQRRAADGGADRACLSRAGGEGDHPGSVHLFGFRQGGAAEDRPARSPAAGAAQHELVPVEGNGDPDNHVIAGDALSPSTTAFLAQRIVVWVEAVAK